MLRANDSSDTDAVNQHTSRVMLSNTLFSYRAQNDFCATLQHTALSSFLTVYPFDVLATSLSCRSARRERGSCARRPHARRRRPERRLSCHTGSTPRALPTPAKNLLTSGRLKSDPITCDAARSV
eukprot:31031-Pelagococcus_subviridis.AAC.14